jgi:hypothetical protein
MPRRVAADLAAKAMSPDLERFRANRIHAHMLVKAAALLGR